MNIDFGNPLSNSIVQWAFIALALIAAVIILRYFFHFIAHIVSFIFQFFWHALGIIVSLYILWYILHYFKLI